MWPANSAYLNEAVNHLSTILAMSPTHCGLVQYPVYQSQTNQATLVKHRHALDLLLLNAGLTVYHHIQLCYEKPDSSARDNRSLSQLAAAVFHANFDNCAWMDSSAVKEGRLGPIPLIRVADFIGYDDVKRPSASARVEQLLGYYSRVKFSFSFLAVRQTKDPTTWAWPPVLQERADVPRQTDRWLVGQHEHSAS